MSKYIKVAAVSKDFLYEIPGDTPETILKRVRSYWEERLKMVYAEKPDFILLPEVCDRVESSAEKKKEYYRYRKNQMLDYFKEKAEANNCYIGYSSVIEMTDGSFRNALQIIDRKGNVTGRYYKNYPTENEMTGSNILCGTGAPIIECDFGRVACVICFDLNFDELMRQYADKRPDIILFSSNYHGGLRAKWWAYESRAYFLAALGCRMKSYLVSPHGEYIAVSSSVYPFVVEKINLDYCVCKENMNRQEFKAAKIKYGDKIRINNAGEIDTVLFTSETDEFNVQTVMKEFNIKSFDSAFNYIREIRKNYIGNDDMTIKG